MSATAVLKRSGVVEFEACVKDGVIEIPAEYRNVFLESVFVEIRAKDEKKELERAFEYGRNLAEKHGFTEEDVNNEIEAYRKEKSGKQAEIKQIINT